MTRATPGILMSFKLNARRARRSIGYITQSFPGLTTTFIYREVYALRKAGFDVSTFAIRKPALEGLSMESRELVDSTHYALPVRPLSMLAAHVAELLRRPLAYLGTLVFILSRPGESLANRRRSFFHFVEAVSLLPAARKARIRHIHAHFTINAATIALVFSKLLNISFSFTAHNDFFTDRILLKEKLRESRFVISISEFSKQYLLDLYPEDDFASKISVVRCGISTKAFQPRRKDPQNDLPLIYSVSQIVERKGYPYLIEACRILKERGVSFRCHIAGDGPGRAELAKLIKAYDLNEQITLLGVVFQENLIDQLRGADVFVLPCITTNNGDMDGIPVVLMEAMSMALPCVSTYVSGIPELIEHYDSGLLVPQKDPKALADALGELIENPDKRKRLGFSARNKVNREFNIETNVALLCALFESSIDD